MGQDQGDVGPAHAGPHGQQPVHHVHQGPVLWERRSVTTRGYSSAVQIGDTCSLPEYLFYAHFYLNSTATQMRILHFFKCISKFGAFECEFSR